jgi:hypothetical protein
MSGVVGLTWAVLTLVFTAGGAYAVFKRNQKDLNGLGKKVEHMRVTGDERHYKIHERLHGLEIKQSYEMKRIDRELEHLTNGQARKARPKEASI